MQDAKNYIFTLFASSMQKENLFAFQKTSVFIWVG